MRGKSNVVGIICLLIDVGLVNVLFEKSGGGEGGSSDYPELELAELSLLRFVVEKTISCSAFEIKMNLDVT